MLAFYGTFLFTNNGRLIKCWDIFIYKLNQNLGHFHLQVTHFSMNFLISHIIQILSFYYFSFCSVIKIVSSSSVLYIFEPIFVNRDNASSVGWPYLLSFPTDINAIFGLI